MSRIARLAKFIGVVESSDAVLIKHLQGKHDQATHGNWSGHHGQAVDRKNTAEGNPYPHPIQTAYDNVVAGKEGIVSPIDAPAWLDAMADRTDNPDLTNLEILGTQYFTKDNLGIMRDHMPQIPPDTQEAFIKAMQARGVRVDLVDVTPFGLHPIQAEISATKSGKIFRKMKKEGVDDTPITISSDDYVIDGHHRWAAGLFLGLSPKHKGIKLKALRVDMPQEQLVDVVLAWNKAVGISSIPLGADVKQSMKKMLAFDIAVLKAKIKSTEVEKHLSGQHDQSTHGRRFNSEVAPEVVHDVLSQVAENGGLSIKLTDGSLPPDGYMVSRNSDKFGTVVTASDFFNEKKGAKILGAFLIKNKSELGSGRAYLGVWHETTKTVNGVTVEIPKDQQQVHLDVTDKIVSKKQAMSLGRRRNQISIWDVVNFDEIQTGGTGGTVEKGNYKHSLIPETVESDDGRGNYGLGGKDLREVAEASVIVQVPVDSDFFKHLAGQHDQSSHGSWAHSDEHIKSLFEKTLTSNGKSMSVHVGSIEKNGSLISVKGTVTDAQGNPAGEWQRDIDTKTKTMDLVGFTLGNWQGDTTQYGAGDALRRNGLGKEFHKQSEQIARELGLNNIRVFAVSDGSSAWASQSFGFDWDVSHPDFRDSMDHLKRQIKVLLRPPRVSYEVTPTNNPAKVQVGNQIYTYSHPALIKPENVQALQNLSDRFEGDVVANYPKPYEVLNVVSDTTTSNTTDPFQEGRWKDYTLGEQILSGGWQGVKSTDFVTKSVKLMRVQVIGVNDVIKHLQGQHDQSSHGSWAKTGGVVHKPKNLGGVAIPWKDSTDWSDVVPTGAPDDKQIEFASGLCLDSAPLKAVGQGHIFTDKQEIVAYVDHVFEKYGYGKRVWKAVPDTNNEYLVDGIEAGITAGDVAEGHPLHGGNIPVLLYKPTGISQFVLLHEVSHILEGNWSLRGAGDGGHNLPFLATWKYLLRYEGLEKQANVLDLFTYQDGGNGVFEVSVA